MFEEVLKRYVKTYLPTLEILSFAHKRKLLQVLSDALFSPRWSDSLYDQDTAKKLWELQDNRELWVSKKETLSDFIDPQTWNRKQEFKTHGNVAWHTLDVFDLYTEYAIIDKDESCITNDMYQDILNALLFHDIGEVEWMDIPNNPNKPKTDEQKVREHIAQHKIIKDIFEILNKNKEKIEYNTTSIFETLNKMEDKNDMYRKYFKYFDNMANVRWFAALCETFWNNIQWWYKKYLEILRDLDYRNTNNFQQHFWIKKMLLDNRKSFEDIIAHLRKTQNKFDKEEEETFQKIEAQYIVLNNKINIS